MYGLSLLIYTIVDCLGKSTISGYYLDFSENESNCVETFESFFQRSNEFYTNVTLMTGFFSIS